MCLPAVLQVNRMLSFALNSKRLKDKLMDTSALIAEVRTGDAARCRALWQATLVVLGVVLARRRDPASALTGPELE